MASSPPVSTAATADDEDSDQSYRGFFTVHRSADFMLKICFTLISFVFILVLTSLHITRKKYRLPSVFGSSRLRRACEIFKLDGVIPELPQIQGGESLAITCPSGWLVLHRICFQEAKLPIQPYSCAPGWLREESFGLLFSCASPERRILAYLVDYAIHDIPSIRIETVVREEIESLLMENLNLVDGHVFDSIARRCLMRLLLNTNDSDEPEHREKIRAISNILDDLKSIHYGQRSLSTWDRFSYLFGFNNSARNALGDIKKFLEFPIRLEMENVNQNFSSMEDSNFLQTFISARMELEDEGDQTSFLTVAHLAHAAIDCQLISEEILIPAYRWTLLILGHKPHLAEQLCEEVNSNNSRVGACARAFALELIRWTQIGSHMSSVQLLDDWSMAQIDFPIRSILQYDMKSVANDPQIWGDPECFRPERFEVSRGMGCGWSTRVNGSDEALDALLDASGWGTYVPVEFLIQIIAAGVTHLSVTLKTLKLKVEGNEELKVAPHSYSRMPAPFTFQLREC